MKLSLRIIMAFCLIIVLNTLSFGASYSTSIGTPNEESVAKDNVRTKVKDFLQKRVFKKVKNSFKNIKKSWKTYKEAEGKKGILSLSTIFLLLATATLVVLKILEIIAWSWFWVFAPLWIPVALVILLLIIAFVFIATKKGE
jgi:sterol desaturase/sphingolipid hydroxylase (fatty acid hydroxylase superfamily)